MVATSAMFVVVVMVVIPAATPIGSITPIAIIAAFIVIAVIAIAVVPAVVPAVVIPAITITVRRERCRDAIIYPWGIIAAVGIIDAWS